MFSGEAGVLGCSRSVIKNSLMSKGSVPSVILNSSILKSVNDSSLIWGREGSLYALSRVGPFEDTVDVAGC